MPGRRRDASSALPLPSLSATGLLTLDDGYHLQEHLLRFVQPLRHDAVDAVAGIVVGIRLSRIAVTDAYGLEAGRQQTAGIVKDGSGVDRR